MASPSAREVAAEQVVLTQHVRAETSERCRSLFDYNPHAGEDKSLLLANVSHEVRRL